MLLDWPIRTKLTAGLGLLLVTVLALFGSAYYGLYAYRGLVKDLAWRSAELPLTSEIQKAVGVLVTISQAQDRLEYPFYDESADWHSAWLGDQWSIQLIALERGLNDYREQLKQHAVDTSSELTDNSSELQTLAEIDRVVAKLRSESPTQLLNDGPTGEFRRNVETLHRLCTKLPTHLSDRMQHLVSDVRSQYRTAIAAAWVNVLVAVVLLAAARRVFYKWFADPLHTLVSGSRKVAAGNFEHRIEINTGDEIGELAEAMNAMTDRFREIRNDLDRQVQERTSQVVRSEQLASVGFLAAGVSHEINNPLASIALCSESLESRLQDLLDGADAGRAEDVQVARNYLQMIQREAFRCKQITEKLLDFARRGDSQRHAADLRDLAEGVIDMVQHLGQYHNKRLELMSGVPVITNVNAQELKQVVLNLITNGLESLDAGGVVRVTVERDAQLARIIIEDNGCGMTDEVRKHLFEPFFTRRRSGQGTGLGLSITHRIVEEHNGRIDVTSDGPGRGSRFVVSLPAATESKETHHRYQAA